ncbi:type II toxin-antitoxin system VapB family antitoxin [Phenylobacterium sp. SCN 70-31]|uniref:type II toxin-antitoxin system VapB family antitoxin n=1 Tax=Phenylobacterium sp. SCN 70-31 TaxID=1660129 RepID=UPI00086D360E|nr:type II toxin-antitoxin system VapB family antitoxin [Phenylobacterium sp. SCN 70-31]ODT86273.1 MAG: hypothetical protein ABS78_17265 [Phenylobacterium sp. SCN 70-31]
MTKPIQIRKEDVASDIRRLATLTGESITDAVAEAVREKLDRIESDRGLADRRRRVRELVASFAALPKTGHRLTDDDLYDDYGLPK